MRQNYLVFIKRQNPIFDHILNKITSLAYYDKETNFFRKKTNETCLKNVMIFKDFVRLSKNLKTFKEYEDYGKNF
jgi:hypothetical protein